MKPSLIFVFAALLSVTSLVYAQSTPARKNTYRASGNTAAAAPRLTRHAPPGGAAVGAHAQGQGEPSSEALTFRPWRGCSDTLI